MCLQLLGIQYLLVFSVCMCTCVHLCVKLQHYQVESGLHNLNTKGAKVTKDVAETMAPTVIELTGFYSNTRSPRA